LGDSTVPAKRQHYVPQFYLDYFALPNRAGATPTFWVYDKRGDEPRPQTPVNTAVESHFYTLSAPEGEKDHSLEEMLAKVESLAKPILDGWQGAHARPQERERLDMAGFLALMHTRGPRNLEAAEEAGQIVAHELLKAAAEDRVAVEARLKRTQLGLSVEEATEALRHPKEHVKIGFSDKAPLAMSLSQTPDVIVALANMHWSLCVAPTGAFFITGDAPLCVFVPTRPGHAMFGGGMALPGVEITFPISPSLCLLVTWRARQRRMRVDGEFVDERNRRTAHMAERFVISPYRTRRIAEVVQEARVTLDKPKLNAEYVAQAVRARLAKQNARGTASIEQPATKGRQPM